MEVIGRLLFGAMIRRALQGNRATHKDAHLIRMQALHTTVRDRRRALKEANPALYQQALTYEARTSSAGIVLIGMLVLILGAAATLLLPSGHPVATTFAIGAMVAAIFATPLMLHGYIRDPEAAFLMLWEPSALAMKIEGFGLFAGIGSLIYAIFA